MAAAARRNNSGDIFLAFSTANDPGPLPEPPRLAFSALSNDDLDPLFLGAVEAVEESVLNAMLAADTMTGKHGRRVAALDPRASSRFSRSRPELAKRTFTSPLGERSRRDSGAGEGAMG